MPNISKTSLYDDARQRIEELCRNYDAELRSDKLKRYTEEDVKKGFILPLFEALGWDSKNRDEVSSEEHIKSSGRVDYGFYLDDRPKFYLEAKSIKANIHDEQWARQAIRYSWNKGVTWAVLTNFERLLVFNAQDIKSSLQNKLLFDISYRDYAASFERLELLSKTAFASNELDTYAEKIGKKFQRVPISLLLYKDLDECREILTKSLAAWNKEKFVKNPTLLDEGVQKLLDRLIFMRVAEDRGVEPPTLIPLIREWDASKNKSEVPLYETMVSKFREFDATYNSNLFSKHPFETWEEYDRSTEKVIKILYGKEGYYEYDFKAMPADVLGTVYENYLGHRLSQSKKGVTLDKDAGKRKEQGIYYTPSFIVDYIVKHALQPVLDRCKTIDQLRNVKVLDPACGSGSFLIKALEILNDKYKALGEKGDEMTKLTILTNNIYGVDLDEQAVEIARLNLCINSLDGKMKLPYLTDNIKCGNSLISGTDAELKKHFGTSWRDKKPFNWQEEFPSVFAQGGFDVVIGNPPYIDSEEMAKSQPDFRDYCVEKYVVARGNWDLFCIFIEQGINVLKRDGRLGMIVPNKIISAKYALATRNLLSDNSVLALADYSSIAVFGASVYPIVVIAGKGEDRNHHLEITVNHGVDSPTSSTVRTFPGAVLSEHKDSWAPLFEEREGLDFLNRIINASPKLEEIKSFNVVGAATVGEAYEIKKIIREIVSTQDDFKFINTGTIDRYRSLWGLQSTRYIKDSYNEPSLPKDEFKKTYPKRYEQASSPKIIIGGMSKVLECYLDEDGQYVPGKSTTIILGDNVDSLKILLGILNSRLVSAIYSRIFKSLSLAGGFFRIGTPQIKLLPISLPKGQVAKDLIILVDKISDLNTKLAVVEKNSNEWERLKAEINQIDKKIDEQVFKLYNLTEEEIKIIDVSVLERI